MTDLGGDLITRLRSDANLRQATAIYTGAPKDGPSRPKQVKDRAEEAGFDPSRVCCHTFRGTGITAYLENGGKLEVAQHLTGHADASTTKLYDRRKELVSKEKVEKSGI